jgi:prepilin-type N-terminal cleavage/methylation domain-containing protein/uncharacterized repeat protein (TIGR02543 family)
MIKRVTNKLKKKLVRGFTIIELLVVISIISILASVVIISINSARNKSRDTLIKSQLSSIRVASGLAFGNSGYGIATSDNGCEGLVSNSAFGDLMTPWAWPAIDGLSVVPICYSDATAGGEINAYSMWHALVTGGGWCVDSTGKSQAKNSAPGAADCGVADEVGTGGVACSSGVPGYVVTGGNVSVAGNYYENGSTNGQPVYSRDTGTYSVYYNSANSLWLIGTTPGSPSDAPFFSNTGPAGQYTGFIPQSGTATVTYDDCLPTAGELPGAVTYSVTYSGNGNTGGSVPVDSNNYANGDLFTILGNTGSLVKTGYTFASWNWLADGTGMDQTPGSTSVMGSVNITLYARWTADQPPAGPDLTADSMTISGHKASYSPGEAMTYVISTIASDGLVGAPDRGFGVQYWSYDQAGSQNATYDSSTEKWNVGLTAPPTSGSYSTIFSFYCSRPIDGICSEGDVETTLPFTVVADPIACYGSETLSGCSTILAGPAACNNSWESITNPMQCVYNPTNFTCAPSGIICNEPAPVLPTCSGSPLTPPSTCETFAGPPPGCMFSYISTPSPKQCIYTTSCVTGDACTP